jgi:hypothetical protein
MDARILREKILQLKKELADAETQLEKIELHCRHQWKESTSQNRVEGYNYPGDPPGTMGVDRQLPCYVPGYYENVTTKKCTICGKIIVNKNRI